MKTKYLTTAFIAMLGMATFPVSSADDLSLPNDDNLQLDVSGIGDVSADEEFNQGIKYLKGDGVPRNTEEGIKLILNAEGKGHTGARCVLGLLCLSEGNLQKAKHWFMLAANYNETVCSMLCLDGMMSVDYLGIRSKLRSETLKAHSFFGSDSLTSMEVTYMECLDVNLVRESGTYGSISKIEACVCVHWDSITATNEKTYWNLTLTPDFRLSSATITSASSSLNDSIDIQHKKDIGWGAAGTAIMALLGYLLSDLSSQ